MTESVPARRPRTLGNATWWPGLWQNALSDAGRHVSWGSNKVHIIAHPAPPKRTHSTLRETLEHMTTTRTLTAGGNNQFISPGVRVNEDLHPILWHDIRCPKREKYAVYKVDAVYAAACNTMPTCILDIAWVKAPWQFVLSPVQFQVPENAKPPRACKAGAKVAQPRFTVRTSSYKSLHFNIAYQGT